MRTDHAIMTRGPYAARLLHLRRAERALGRRSGRADRSEARDRIRGIPIAGGPASGQSRRRRGDRAGSRVVGDCIRGKHASAGVSPGRSGARNQQRRAGAQGRSVAGGGLEDPTSRRRCGPPGRRPRHGFRNAAKRKTRLAPSGCLVLLGSENSRRSPSAVALRRCDSRPRGCCYMIIARAASCWRPAGVNGTALSLAQGERQSGRRARAHCSRCSISTAWPGRPRATAPTGSGRSPSALVFVRSDSQRDGRR
jgi:hypothetical protein